MIGFVGALVIVALVLLVLNGALQWPGSRQGSLRPDPEVTVRLARIENTLRLLESRLDSVEEQQQFLERLLSDRADPRALPPSDPPASEPPGDTEDSSSILFDVDETGEDR